MLPPKAVAWEIQSQDMEDDAQYELYQYTLLMFT